ncbi:hypothetical protein KC19_3G180800 [Ceratodon purpureus]|uniref:NB-ARC domain-containing protein n=1 Tax=Ceratodon purpureus TaxID=3225 RepID=A0A8T0IMF9_CERPU|nr:hypothetical protein KC19_3G180800 [Ceratodon purpureus]
MGKCRDILRKSMSKQKIFLAIDNVWDDSKSIEDAKMYLQTNYHEGSVVLVTSRSLKTLTYLGIKESHCFEMPGLEFQDAKDLFIQHAAYGIKFSKFDDICAINKCVALCYFKKGDDKGGHYLPLALKALGMQLGCLGRNPLEWVKALPKAKDFNYLQEEQNPVFSILRSSFDRLRPMDQSLFMDLIIYYPTRQDLMKWLSLIIYNPKRQDLMEWLGLLYNQDLREIESRVQRLKERGLVETHDLYREFAKLETQGKVDQSVNFEKRRWVYYEDTNPTELEMTPSHRCWQNLTRIAIVESTSTKDGPSLQGIEWVYFLMLCY